MKYSVENGEKTDVITIWTGLNYEIKKEGNKIIINSDYNTNKEVINEEEKKDILKSFLPDVWTKPKNKNEIHRERKKFGAYGVLDQSLKPIYLHRLDNGEVNKEIRIEQWKLKNGQIRYKYYSPCPQCGDNENFKPKNGVSRNNNQKYLCTKCGCIPFGHTLGLPSNKKELNAVIKNNGIYKFGVEEV